MMVAVVCLLMLLLLVMMMLLGRPCGPVRSSTSRAPVQPPIPGVTRCPGAAVTSRAVNGGWRDGVSRVEGAGGHGIDLMLIQGMRMQMMMMMVVSRFRRRISAGPRSVTNGVFHKRVHVVHAQTGGTVELNKV